MHLALEALCAFCMTFYYWLEAIILFFIPAKYRSKDVKGQTVLITGSGSGIGRLVALRFALLGTTVVLVDVNESGNRETQELIRKAGGRAHTYTCDLSKRDQVYAMGNKVKSEVGDVDILVNNAGIVTGRKLLDCPDELMEKTMAVNATAHFWTTKIFLPAMLAKNSGHVVTIASGAGLQGVNGLCDYCASKFAAVGFDESLRYELRSLKKDGIFTTVVCPFFISTGMFDGAVSRFPGLVPIQSPEYAADRIMEAILTNQEMVQIPRLIYTLMSIKGYLPTKSQYVIMDFFGINSSMDTFVGRNKSK